MKEEERKKFLSQRANFFGDNGKPYLVRCPECQFENYVPAVSLGICYNCGYLAPGADENAKVKHED